MITKVWVHAVVSDKVFCILDRFKRKQPDSTSLSRVADAKDIDKRLNFEDDEAEKTQSQLSTVMVEMDRRLDALHLASKDDTDKMKSDFKAEIDNLITTLVRKTVTEVDSERRSPR